MIRSNLPVAILLAVSMLVMNGASLCQAARGVIQEINATPDCRRLVIQYDGTIDSHRTFELSDPSRLVIDFAAVDPGSLPTTTQYRNKPIKALRVGKTSSGARVVVDFGHTSLPDYNIRILGKFVMVLFGPFEFTPRPEEHGKPVSLSRVSRIATQQRVEPRIINAPDSPFMVRSARVSKGRVILDVALRDGSRRRYQVTLGLDLQERGFRTASIVPVNNQRVREAHPNRPRRLVQRASAPADHSTGPAEPPVVKRGPGSIRRSLKGESILASLRVKSRAPSHGRGALFKSATRR